MANTAEDNDSSIELVCSSEHVGWRLDLFVVSQLEVSRAAVQDWIKSDRVLIAGRPAKASSKLKLGQKIEVSIPPLAPAVPQPDPSISIEVLFEDEHILALNKPRGLVVHPAPGNPDKTLVNGLLAHCSDWSGIGGVSRPGIVHRLDKETSGVMVVAKHDQAHQALSQQFSERNVVKIYRALVWGVPQPRRGRINQPLGRHPGDRLRMACVPTGKPAVTDYEVVQTFAETHSLVELQLHTGRTHQIRVHLTWLGYPIVGDPVYGKSGGAFGMQGQALHSSRLEVAHPGDGRPLIFQAPMPLDMTTLVERLAGTTL